MYAIGAVAKATGLKIPTIRFYEAEGLIDAPERTGSGRRLYSDADMKRLSFIRHTRALGFELDDIRSMLVLSDRPEQPCGDVDLIARRQLEAIETRIAQLKALRKELSRVVQSCAGGKVRECRVIEALADHEYCAAPHPAPAKAVKRRRAAHTQNGRRAD